MVEPSESANWKSVYGVAVVLVLAFFLFSLRSILNPFVLFVLLVFLMSPQAGSRPHLLVVGASGVLTLFWLLHTTGFLLAPFILALALAYILNPLVGRLARGRLGRSAAIGLLALPLMGAIAVGILVGIPALSHQVADFIQRVPELIPWAIARGEALQVQLLRRDLPYLDEEALLARLRSVQPDQVVAYLQTRQEELARRVWDAVLGVGRGVGSVLSILSYVFLTPILTFYLLRDYHGITGRLAALVPRSRQERWLGFFREYDRLLAAYLRGQLLAAAIVGVLTAVGFWLLDFPYALLLGVIAGVFNVVPYMGLVVSLIPALVIALFSGAVLLSLGKIALVFTVVQLLDGSVVGPKIVGESVGLHPVWVILALAVSGYFFGFVGLLIAVPLAVLVKLLLLAGLTRYQRSRIFRGDAVTEEALRA